MTERSNKQKAIHIILTFCLLSLGGCANTFAPDGSAITIVPDAVTIGVGVAGDTSFYEVLVTVAGKKGLSEEVVPLAGVEVFASLFFLRLVDEDGNFVSGSLSAPGGAFYTTDGRGEARIVVEVPLGVEYEDTLSITSGAAAATIKFTSTPS